MNTRAKNALAVFIVLAASGFVVVGLLWATMANDWPFFVPFFLFIVGVAIATVVTWAFGHLAG